MSKPRPFNEAIVMRVVRGSGRFSLNPLAWRNRGKVKLLDNMTSRGLISKHTIKLDYVEYRNP